MKENGQTGWRLFIALVALLAALAIRVCEAERKAIRKVSLSTQCLAMCLEHAEAEEISSGAPVMGAFVVYGELGTASQQSALAAKRENAACAAKACESAVISHLNKISKYADDRNYPGFYGRLHVPAVGIDVALYDDYSQAVTDRKDSACIFCWKPSVNNSVLIADHANQDFGALKQVTVGTSGYIELADGTRDTIYCTAVLNGHNVGSDLVDENYNVVYNAGRYLMYTCLNGWQNVRICVWD